MTLVFFIVPVLLSVASWLGVKYLTRNVSWLDHIRNSIFTILIFMMIIVQVWNRVLHAVFPAYFP